MGSLLRLKSDLEDLDSIIKRCEESYHSLEKVKSVDFNSRDSGKDKLAVGCATFSAFSGTPVEDQISEEVSKWKRAKERALLKSSNHRWIGVDMKIMSNVDKALYDFVGRSRNPVPVGKIRQYFVAQTSNHGARVLQTIDMDEKFVLNTIKRKRISRGDLSSTEKIRRGGKFSLGALALYLKRIKDSRLALKGELEHELTGFLGRANIQDMESHKWTESLTDLKSSGGFLVKTNAHSNDMRYCPECFYTLKEAFDVHSGESPISLPHLPDLIIQLQVNCTENKHRGHTLDDCLEVDFMEREINEIRDILGAPLHRTIVCVVRDKSLKERHGNWLWVRADQL